MCDELHNVSYLRGRIPVVAENEFTKLSVYLRMCVLSRRILSYLNESSTARSRAIGHAHHKAISDLVPPLPSIAPPTTPTPAMAGQAGVTQSPERVESGIAAPQTTPLDEWQVAFMGLNHWRLAGAVLALLVLSFIVANAIAFCFQVRRERRIRRKTIELAQFGPNHVGSDDKSTLQPVPVTILTGFLGAGKTTLLNRILQTPQLPYKIMVLENEIGTVSIDHALLDPSKTNEELQKDGIYVLQNGCMCCTARGAKGTKSELERILDYLLRIVNEQGFDYLVVETTGLADPGPIIETFLQLRASRFRLDAIVTMVDAHAIQRFYNPQRTTFDLPVELQRQFLYADVVALNKVDLVDATELQRARDAVTAFANGATTLECVQANVDLAQIVGIDTFDAVKFQGANGALGTDKGEHTKGITSVFLEVEAAVDVAKLTEWLNAVTAEYARAHILRIKGVLALSNSNRRCILQGVLDTYTIAPSAAWTPSDTRKCRLVVIGKHLDRGHLEDSFRQCIVRRNDEETGKKEDWGDTLPSRAAPQEAKKTR
jgi:G3E family GTPase